MLQSESGRLFGKVMTAYTLCFTISLCGPRMTDREKKIEIVCQKKIKMMYNDCERVATLDDYIIRQQQQQQRRRVFCI